MPRMKPQPETRSRPRPSPAILCYITCKDRQQARRIGLALLQERLAACFNLLGAVQSSYWWQGAICHAREVVLIAKTRRTLLPRLTRRVISLHSYEVPCVVALPILGGHAPYLSWLEAETRPGSGDG
jgi:periplasmic divalent cation tolerance protein